MPEDDPRQAFREQLNVVIFGTETPAGRAFDIALLAVIGLSIIAISLESVSAIEANYSTTLDVAEFLFTAIFTVEYAARIYCARRRLAYVVSFFGFVDLLSLLPTYLSLLFGGASSLLAIRALRLFRVFRVFKVVRMMGEATSLLKALRSSIPKITVFLGAVLTIVIVIGSVMYVVEGAEHGFTSIPRSMYWAIVTLTTVGYGDVAPSTVLGQTLAAALMIMGYGIIAVPTGIVSAEFVQGQKDPQMKCHACSTVGHSEDSTFCRVCGAELV